MYAKAERTGQESDKRELNRMKAIMEKKVREVKYAQFEKYISEMDQLGPTEPKSASTRIIKAKAKENARIRPRAPLCIQASPQPTSPASGERTRIQTWRDLQWTSRETEFEGGLQQST